MVETPLRLIDIFSGAGGITLGFVSAFPRRFVPVWANDFNEYAIRTYNENFGTHGIHGDILNILEDQNVEIPKADIVIGGPPCQGFSLLNRKRQGDRRRQLRRPFLEVVRRVDALLFVMENVPQLLGSPEHEAITREAQRLGFQTASVRLCAADYGVPQVRFRAFILGSRIGVPAPLFPPPKTHFDPDKRLPAKAAPGLPESVGELRPWRTVREAVGDLPPPEGRDPRGEPPPLDPHFGRNPTPKSLARYKAIPEEGMNRFDLQKRAPELTPGCWIRKTAEGTDLFGRLWWDRPAFTIRTEFFKPEKGRYLHPEQQRPITHREAARFQTFPDNFRFLGTKIEIARQIGNAVPPLLAAVVARAVEEVFREASVSVEVKAANA